MPCQSTKENLFLVRSLIELCKVHERLLKHLSSCPSFSPFLPLPPLQSLSCQYSTRNPLLDMTEKAVVQQKWYGLLQQITGFPFMFSTRGSPHAISYSWLKKASMHLQSDQTGGQLGFSGIYHYRDRKGGLIFSPEHEPFLKCGRPPSESPRQYSIRRNLIYSHGQPPC